ncbi:hypothetical protein N0V93_002801 [Gnomoniopsis smithogilvyi]|uniref:Uncharacterized protein n=1 Tax=Gnomoniopsis smithogilvyi TaxID=1191159 RepID=A0A9W8YY77_9PEZI|nr:hypothetical protein N0V93_002801 [Gnomoniopsis smithogilvyi]
MVYIAYTFPSPAEGYENAAPLPEEVSEDGKSLKNPETGVLSKAYEAFIDPLEKGRRGGFDIHIYYTQSQMEYARQLYDRIRREFPELRIYRFWDKPVVRGVHPLVGDLARRALGAGASEHYRGGRGLLSEAELRNHTQRATWMGEKVPLDVSMFLKWRQKEIEEKEKGKQGA